MDDEEEKPLPLEEVFLQSWNGIEKYFKGMKLIASWKHMDYMVNLISLLRECGYDRHLRAGQSMASFIVSRSREHGLKRGQLSMRFGVNSKGEMAVTLSGPDIQVNLNFDRVEITPELETLLKMMVAYPTEER